MTIWIAPDCPAEIEQRIRAEAAERGEDVMPRRPFPWNRRATDEKTRGMIRISSRFITVDGKRVGVRYDVGPWIEGVPAELIKVRPRNGRFPDCFRAVFEIENRSDAREDYFEPDAIRILPSHPLYEQIRAAAAAR